MGKKQLVIIVICAVVGLITVIGLLFYNQDERTSWDGDERYDANSGETVSDPQGKATDLDGSDPTTNSLLFLGLVELTRGGATSGQLENTRSALSAFALDKGYEEVSITRDSATTYFDGESAAGLDFKFVMDSDQTLYGRMHTVNLHDVQLLIYSDEARATRVYDSGIISTGPTT